MPTACAKRPTMAEPPRAAGEVRAFLCLAGSANRRLGMPVTAIRSLFARIISRNARVKHLNIASYKGRSRGPVVIPVAWPGHQDSILLAARSFLAGHVRKTIADAQPARQSRLGIPIRREPRRRIR